jgi:hypothetical protein
MPTFASFRSCMPVLWSAELQAALPPAAKDLLAKQKTKMEQDAAAALAGPLSALVTETGEESIRSEYMYAWTLVNTRCFYWDYPGMAKRSGAVKRGRDGQARGVGTKEKRRDRDDCMALCPALDYFNHVDGDGVSLSPVLSS